MRISRLLFPLISVFSLVTLPTPDAAVAESVKMVMDVDQQSDWKMHSSVSSDRMAFHFRWDDSNRSPTLWRSTTGETKEVDVTAIRTNGAALADYDFTLTENNLYVWNGRNELWQIDVDSLQARQVALDSFANSYDYSDVIRDHENSAFYFLVDDNGRVTGERGLRLYKLDHSGSCS